MTKINSYKKFQELRKETAEVIGKIDDDMHFNLFCGAVTKKEENRGRMISKRNLKALQTSTEPRLLAKIR